MIIKLEEKRRETMEKDKKFNMDKHVVDTLNKFEDGPTIEQQVINYSPVKVTPKRKNSFNELVKEDEKEYKANQKNKKILPAKPDEKKGIIKPFRNDDSSTYPVNQKDKMSMWDMMKESARIDARKGDYSGMRQIKKTLHDDYKKSGGKWMNDEEKKMIGKYKQPEPINVDLTTINKGRLLLQQMREDDKRLAEQRKKIFEKNSSHENIGGLAYLLDLKR
jgi:hypothetical protein